MPYTKSKKYPVEFRLKTAVFKSTTAKYLPGLAKMNQAENAPFQ